MSPITYIYEVRPDGDAWVVVEYVPDKISLEVRTVRRTETREEAERLADEDLENAPFGWGLDPRAHGMCEYYDIRPDNDGGWVMVEIVWKPIKTHVKVMERVDTRERAEALARTHQEEHVALVDKMLENWKNRRAGFRGGLTLE